MLEIQHREEGVFERQQKVLKITRNSVFKYINVPHDNQIMIPKSIKFIIVNIRNTFA